jgi:beta-mannosidase
MDPLDYNQGKGEWGKALNILSEKIWIKGILNFWDGRPGGVITTPEDGQSIGSGGIYQDVILSAGDDVSIQWVFITPVLNNDLSSASVNMLVWLKNRNPYPVNLTLNSLIYPVSNARESTGVSRVIIAPPGEVVARVSVGITSPRLWWPWSHPELGSPELYKARVNVTKGGEVVAERSELFGIRKLERVKPYTVEGFTSTEDFVWQVNNKRLFLKGGSYNSSLWTGTVSNETYNRDFAAIKDSNMDMIRVCVYVDRPEMYEIADREGVAIWQDFPLQWEYSECSFERESGDPGLTNNVEVMKRMLAEMILLEYNHPSVFIWSLHNEPYYQMWKTLVGFDSPNMDIKCSEKPYNQSSEYDAFDGTLNRDMDEELMKTAAMVETSRPIHQASGMGDSHSYYGWFEGTVETLFGKTLPVDVIAGRQLEGHHGRAREPDGLQEPALRKRGEFLRASLGLRHAERVDIRHTVLPGDSAEGPH